MDAMISLISVLVWIPVIVGIMLINDWIYDKINSGLGRKEDINHGMVILK